MSQLPPPKVWKMNTSNGGKLLEFQKYFHLHGQQLQSTHIDLKEIDADPLTVVVHKASQVEENVLVEDTSLEIEGADVGIRVRWLLEHLNDFVGRKALWKVLLAYRVDGQVRVYQGVTQGEIVFPKGSGGFGFDPVFQPDGEVFTLAQSKPDSVNARVKAVEALFNNQLHQTHPAIVDWKGPWQTER